MDTQILRPSGTSEEFKDDTHQVNLNANAFIIKNLGNIPFRARGIIYLEGESTSHQSGGGFILHYQENFDIKFDTSLLDTATYNQLVADSNIKKHALVYQELYRNK